MSTSVQTLVVPDLKDILFATDFSSCSEAAIPVIRALALCCGSTVHVVHVVPPFATTAVPLDVWRELDAEYLDAEKKMQSLLASGAFRELACTSAVERGDVGEVLNCLAEAKHIGLIVLGTHGRRGLKKLVIGSTAEQVLRTVVCPVLTIGPLAYRNALAGTHSGPILVALDLDAGPHSALQIAASLAHANHVQLLLLYAVPPSVEVPQANPDSIPFDPAFSLELTARALSTSRRQMQEMIAAQQLQDCNPEIIVESGPAADLIARTAEQKQAAMIVMGAHRTGMQSLASHFPGATASAVLCEAPCPVMTIRD